MKTELIQSLTESFEAHAQRTENGVEYWLARDLQYLLGYAEWRNFNITVISKAKTACELSGHSVSDHFVDVNKTIAMPKGIRPKRLPASEDVKKVERRFASEHKKFLKKPDVLDS